MRFSPLAGAIARHIAPWFNDPYTIRFLRGRDWLFRELELIHTKPGTEFRGHRILANHVWVAFDSQQEPVALVDVGPYDDGTAGLTSSSPRARASFRPGTSWPKGPTTRTCCWLRRGLGYNTELPIPAPSL